MEGAAAVPVLGCDEKFAGYGGIAAPVNVRLEALIPFWLYAVDTRICGVRPKNMPYPPRTTSLSALSGL
jgi:hypothetical protein